MKLPKNMHLYIVLGLVGLITVLAMLELTFAAHHDPDSFFWKTIYNIFF